MAATSRGGWFVGAMAFHGNPYDGHTLKDALKQVQRIASLPEHVFVDMGYRGHGYSGEVKVHVDKRRRGRTAKSLWRWMKRRAAIEPGIGHLKREHRMDRNRLKGIEGDRINAILSAAGMNFRKLLRWAADFFAPNSLLPSILSKNDDHQGQYHLAAFSGSTNLISYPPIGCKSIVKKKSIAPESGVFYCHNH